MSSEENPLILWADDVQLAEGGIFVRNPLKDIIERLEAEGKEIAGIKYDGSYNLEILIKTTLDKVKKENDQETGTAN